MEFDVGNNVDKAPVVNDFIKQEQEQIIREQTEPEKLKNKSFEGDDPLEQNERTDTPKPEELIEPPKQVERSSPPKQVERPEPPKEVERTEPPKEVERTEPPKEVERTEPPKELERTDPPKQENRSDPPKGQEKEGEVKADMTFTKELRKATKDVHKISDLLVNAKFAFALTDDAVWADALFSFYWIYKFFEDFLPADLLPNELKRVPAFEKDLRYFLGENWKDIKPNPSITKYLDHLQEVKGKSDLLLFAYAYQMYMALMSGGQLLQKKRMIARKLWFGKGEEPEQEPNQEPVNIDGGDGGDLEQRPMPVQVTICPPGCAATYFPESITVLKAKLRTVLNENYGKFDDQMKADFIEESRNVFIYNSDVVRSVKGVNRASFRKLALALAGIVSIYLALKLAGH